MPRDQTVDAPRKLVPYLPEFIHAPSGRSRERPVFPLPFSSYGAAVETPEGHYPRSLGDHIGGHHPRLPFSQRYADLSKESPDDGIDSAGRAHPRALGPPPRRRPGIEELLGEDAPEGVFDADEEDGARDRVPPTPWL